MNHLIELKNITKKYYMGDSEVTAVNNVSLTIDAGEFVAIMGPSGSGKSTMLNILGFLDSPSSGSYLISGHDATGIEGDELSLLRNHIAGFIFQQFQLLPKLSATDNVLLPSLYAGKRNMAPTAQEKLDWVGLAHRVNHYPRELSGGEQQRVAIARAMINDPAVIFADEPTGNLDTENEKEIISILKKLNKQGRTIIMVTHENEVAAHAGRIIRMRDGVITSDKKKEKPHGTDVNSLIQIDKALEKKSSSFGRAEFADYIKQAFVSLTSHKMRALLSMLGILIGVAAVISMLAVGEGAKESIETNLNSLGTNILTVRPGFRKSGAVSLQQGAGSRLTIEDGEAFLEIRGVKRVSPGVNDRVQAVYGSRNCNTELVGTGADYAEMKASVPVTGRFFTEKENRTRKKVAVIGSTVAENLFGSKNPAGKKIKINRITFRVIGVLPEKGAAMMRDQDDMIIIPVNTAMYRVLGKDFINDIYVEVTSSEVTDRVKEILPAVLSKRHDLAPGMEHLFEIMDSSEMRKAMMSTTETMSMLLGAVAAISLIVGGVGVMNIMLVSVSERTKEIGLRKAIGGRRKDILLQFLIEAVIMTFSGGIAGIILGVSASLLISAIAGWPVKISLLAAAGASLFSVLIGIGFGFWPAVQGSRLNPIDALRHE